MARILVVDDDGQIRSMLRLTLERAGYETETAPDGEAAVRLQRQKPADLLITDIIMPGRDGLEAIMDFRREFRECKIIAISGEGCRLPGDCLPAARQLGAARVFLKPVERVELLSAVRALVGEGSTAASAGNAAPAGWSGAAADSSRMTRQE